MDSRSRTRAPGASGAIDGAEAAGRSPAGRSTRRPRSARVVSSSDARRPAPSDVARPARRGRRPGRTRSRPRPDSPGRRETTPSAVRTVVAEDIGQPRLADAGLALEQDHPSVALGGAPGRHHRLELASRPTNGKESIPASGPTVAAGAGVSTLGSRSNRPSRIASYSSVVSRSGATPSSRFRTPRPARGTAGSPPVRSPAAKKELDQTAAAQARRAGRARHAGSPPPRLRRRRLPPAERNTGDRAERHGPLDTGCPRRLPIVEGGAVAEREASQERPAARAAAVSRSAKAKDPASRSKSARSTPVAAKSTATWVRPISNPASPSADRSADRVRRSAPGRPRRRRPARTSRPARPARMAAPPRRPARRSRAPCACRRRSAGPLRPPRAARAGGSSTEERNQPRRNGT